MDPNSLDFDTAIEMIRNETYPEGIDAIDMMDIFHASWCGTAVCLFGLAAFNQRLAEGGIANKGMAEYEFNEAYSDWEPDSPRMAAIQSLCAQTTATADQVVQLYDSLDENGVLHIRGEYTNPHRFHVFIYDMLRNGTKVVIHGKAPDWLLYQSLVDSGEIEVVEDEG